MPSFPWTKKGSQGSSGVNSDLYDRPAPRAGQSSPYPPPPPPHHPQQQQSRQHPADPYSIDQSSSAANSSVRSLQSHDLSHSPYQAHYDDSSSRASAQASPNIDTRGAEPRKLFKKRFNLSSSRDNLLENQDEPSSSGRIRRTLSTSRRPDSRNPQAAYPTTAYSNRTSSLARRSTLAAQEPESSGTEAEGLRDLADFFRSTAPTGDPRRPISLIGSPSQAQSHWSEERLQQQPEVTAQAPSYARHSSYEQLRSQPPINETAPPLEPHLERDYEPYHVPAGDHQQQSAPFSHEHEGSHQAHGGDQAYQRQEHTIAYHDHPRGPLAAHGGAASELDAHLGAPPIQTQVVATAAADDPPSDSSRSPVLADMPSNAPSTLQPPPPRRGSVESSEPPTPGMQNKGAYAGQPGPARGQNGQEAVSGRRTPDPTMTTGEGEQDIGQLMRDYKELREKYSKVKRYYFEKDDQVKTLQNALAHQKLSQSRTSLDDGEYMARLMRLDGLISQLAFNFRKDWQTMPTWLQPYVNKDAIIVGKQEMTAVGRAFISKWLAEEVFEKYFHPGLEFEVSRELKTIQRNIRVFTPALQTGEEEEALTNKIINWRLATMDGLQHIINSPESTQRRQTLVELLSAQLVTNLLEHMNEPPPAGIDGAVHMIVELAVAVLVNLPFESREVNLEYFLPGQPISPDLMRVEQGIPALVSPMAEPPAEDRGSVRSHSSEMQRDDMQQDEQGGQAPPMREESAKKSLFGLMGGNKKATPAKGGSGAANSQSSLLQPPGSSGGPKEERVRLCVSLGLQIRGKMVLQKAPVFKM